ncbi:nucleotidyltransferase domain-containing protein [Methanobrevibacter sp. DSM 116169]|uniref:nucleotidyltransferase domain-containing protein n=1 Tax=Methanobrevibacter sp. DSM 116169 TaxID=3242727 RepID=UPI0038FCA7E0
MDRKKLAIDFAKSLNFPQIEKVILFGSVAREEDGDESDIDILIITKNEKDDFKFEDEIYSIAFDKLLETGEYLSVKIISLQHYKKYKHFSFYKNIEKDGVLIR